MTFALVGPGAIGSTIAALLYAAGHDMLLCGRTAREHIEVRVDGDILTLSATSTDADGNTTSSTLTWHRATR